jgi:hypothetical protein
MNTNEAFEILRSLPREWGVSEAEVQAVEAQIGVRLPPPLRELMLCAERREHMRSLFPNGEIAALDELIETQETFLKILVMDDPSTRPEFPFVAISNDRDDYFTFVRAIDSDPDPEVLNYDPVRGFNFSIANIHLSLEIAIAVRNLLSSG